MDTRGSVPNQIHINPNAYHDAYQLGSVLFPNVDLPISLTNGFHSLVNDHQLGLIPVFVEGPLVRDGGSYSRLPFFFTT